MVIRQGLLHAVLVYTTAAAFAGSGDLRFQFFGIFADLSVNGVGICSLMHSRLKAFEVITAKAIHTKKSDIKALTGREGT